MNKTNTAEEREFFNAIATGRIDTVRDLVGSRPELLDAYDYGSFGATPVTRVCFHGNRAMLEALVGLGADLDRRSDWSMGPWSPLHCAAFNRNTELTNLLLKHGATLDVHTAASLGRIDDIKKLLDAAPDRVTEQGGDGCHPLHFADTTEVAQLLLERGADIEARCIDHYSTPVQYLASVRPEVATFLFAKGAKADIFSAIMADDFEVVQTLIADNPDAPNTRMNQETFPPGPEHDVHNIMTFTVGGDSTPLHAAAKANRPSMVQLLVNAGLSPNVRGGYDDATPLHLAAWEDNPEVATALLNNGADINARSGKIHNNSPAGWAIVAGSADVFALLMDRGAEILDWFAKDAAAAVNGEFRRYKYSPQQNYDRIQKRLGSA